MLSPLQAEILGRVWDFESKYSADVPIATITRGQIGVIHRLTAKGLLKRTKRGHYRVTIDGRNELVKQEQAINKGILHGK